MITENFFPAESFRLAAEPNPGARSPKRPFTMTAYTGRPVNLRLGRIIFDLEGLRLPQKQIPILYGHDHNRIAGYTDLVYNAGRGLEASGDLILSYQDGTLNPDGIFVANNADAGFEWQCSIGVGADMESELIPANQEATVNGYELKGPIWVARAWTVSEISFCALGADSQTSAAILKAANIKEEEWEVMNNPEKNQPPAVADSKTETARKVAELEARLAQANLMAASADLSVLEARHGFQLSAELKDKLSHSLGPEQIRLCADLAGELAAAVKPEAGQETIPAALLKELRPDLFEKEKAPEASALAEDLNPVVEATVKAAQKCAEDYQRAGGKQ